MHNWPINSVLDKQKATNEVRKYIELTKTYHIKICASLYYIFVYGTYAYVYILYIIYYTYYI